MRPLKCYVCVSDGDRWLGYVMNRYSTELLCSYNRNIYNNIIKHLFWNYHVDIAMVIEIYYKRDFM